MLHALGPSISLKRTENELPAKVVVEVVVLVDVVDVEVLVVVVGASVVVEVVVLVVVGSTVVVVAGEQDSHTPTATPVKLFPTRWY